jgi:hypothetical protein
MTLHHAYGPRIGGPAGTPARARPVSPLPDVMAGAGAQIAEVTM